MTLSAFGSGTTFDGGRYRAGEILRGHSVHGVRSGVRTVDGHRVLITIRLRHWTEDVAEELRLNVPGIAPLLFVGAPDTYVPPKVPTTGGTLGVVIESRPPGTVLSDLATQLDDLALVRIGIGLFSIVAAGNLATPILGIRPETTYVSMDSAGPSVSGIAPRSIRILSHHHDGYARAFEHSYLAPELYSSGDASSTSDLFSAALTLWSAFTGAHAYRVSPDDVDEDVMAADDRGPFPGSPELAAILEPILVAEPSKRPSVAEVKARMDDLGRRWGVVAPLFPPPAP